MAAVLFISFAVLLLLGVPVGFTIAIAAFITLVAGDVPALMMVQRIFTAQDSFSLIAVPFFILAGDLMSKGAVSKVLVEFAESLLGWIRGGLTIVSVLAGMFFAAISGSGAATTAAVGATLIPELEKRGYHVDKSAALIAAAGTIGVVIPPSVPMVLYAVIAEQSVNTLFRNGFIPGITMGVILIVIALVEARKLNYPKGTPLSVKSAKTSSVIMLIIGFSGPFGWVLANWKIPEMISKAVLSVSSNTYIILFLIGLIILVAGVFMETSSAIILLTPVFLPLVKAMGVNLVHFGVVFAVGLAIGMITPPVAINLFVASGITGLPMTKISKAIVPYLIGLIVVFFVILYAPLAFPGLILA